MNETKELTGRELDAAVAEKVIGATNVGWDDNGYTNALVGELPYGFSTRNQGWLPGRQRIPHYSTDIAAAWEVVEKVADRFWCRVETGGSGPWVTFGKRGYESITWEDSLSPTVPEAICRAALRAVREGGEE
jgi:hypothetical protein